MNFFETRIPEDQKLRLPEVLLSIGRHSVASNPPDSLRNAQQHNRERAQSAAAHSVQPEPFSKQHDTTRNHNKEASAIRNREGNIAGNLIVPQAYASARSPDRLHTAISIPMAISLGLGSYSLDQQHHSHEQKSTEIKVEKVLVHMSFGQPHAGKNPQPNTPQPLNKNATSINRSHMSYASLRCSLDPSVPSQCWACALSIRLKSSRRSSQTRTMASTIRPRIPSFLKFTTS